MRRLPVGDEHATIALTPLDLVIQLEEWADDVEMVVLGGRFAEDELAREIVECYPRLRVVISRVDAPLTNQSPAAPVPPIE